MRLSDLPEAGALYRALGFVESKTNGVPFEPKEIDELARCPLLIVYEPLVAHLVHGQRQHRAPMVHQQAVVVVIAAELPEVIGEPERLAEVREVDGGAGVEAFARAVHDSRGRQDRGDQAQCMEIRGQLVRHTLGCRRQSGKPLHEGLAQPFGILSCHRRRRFRESGADRKARDDLRNQRKLAAAEAGGVAGHDLFDARGARARHADDEDGPGGGVSVPAVQLEEGAVEDRDEALDVVAVRVGVEVDGAPLELVPAPVGGERLVIRALFLEDLGEGEVEADLPLGLEPRVLEHRPNPAHLLRAARKRIHQREVVVGRPRIRVELERALETASGLFEMTLVLEGAAEADMRFGELGRDTDRLPVAFEGPVHLAEVGQGVTQAVVRLREVGLEADGPL